MITGTEKVFPVQVRDFIEIPAWGAIGCVMDVKESDVGSDDCIQVLLQEDPEDPASNWKVYRLEPGQFEVV